jgi:hypothetical protein
MILGQETGNLSIDGRIIIDVDVFVRNGWFC